MQAQRSVPPPPSEQHPIGREFRHAARNLLTVISVNTEWVAEMIDDDEQRSALADILDACTRLSGMVETDSTPAFEASPVIRLVRAK